MTSGRCRVAFNLTATISSPVSHLLSTALRATLGRANTLPNSTVTPPRRDALVPLLLLTFFQGLVTQASVAIRPPLGRILRLRERSCVTRHGALWGRHASRRRARQGRCRTAACGPAPPPSASTGSPADPASFAAADPRQRLACVVPQRVALAAALGGRASLPSPYARSTHGFFRGDRSDSASQPSITPKGAS